MRLAVLGAGGHGKVVADAARLCGWDEIEFFDDARQGMAADWNIVGRSEDILVHAGAYDGLLVALGDNQRRLAWCRRIPGAGGVLAKIVHPSAVVSPRADIGSGSVILAGTVINIDTKLGIGCIVNTGATIDHDCHLADGVHISPGAHVAGTVHIGSEAWIGMGAAIRNNVSIGEGAIVGMGSVVLADVAAGSTVIGVPAREVSKSQ